MVNGLADRFRSLQRGELPLAVLVPPQEILEACQSAGYRTRAMLYTPVSVVLTFLAQLISADRSCQQAVNGVVAHQVAAGRKKPSADTGGYCKARQNLPEKVFWELARRSGRQAEQAADPAWHWQGRRVRIVDGSTLRIADTAKNRSEYPLQRNLKPGLHYPVVRILVIFSLAVGTVLDAALRPYQGKGTGETGMLRDLADLLEPGDILLGDRYFSGYWDIAFWQARGVDVVSCISVSRKIDFRKGTRLGRCDHLIEWQKTARPDWADDDLAHQVPPRLRLRELRIRVPVRGFRTRRVHIVTTLLDAEVFSSPSLGELYRFRWQAELNLRSLKIHLGMEQLRCKSPEMLRKEFATYLLSYNSIRRMGLEGARWGEQRPHEISFQHTRQSLNEFLPRFHQSQDRNHWLNSLLETLAEVPVAHRPDRIEPYTCKTRPKDWPPPQQTRQAYKAFKTKKK